MSGHQSYEAWIPERLDAHVTPESLESLLPPEQMVWSLIDGSQTIQQIAARSGLIAEVVYRMLLSWKQRGMVRWKINEASPASDDEVMDVFLEEVSLEDLQVVDSDGADGDDEIEDVDLFEVEVLPDEGDDVPVAGVSPSTPVAQDAVRAQATPPPLEASASGAFVAKASASSASRESLLIPGASSGRAPSSDALRIPGAGSGAAPRDAAHTLKIPGASSGALPGAVAHTLKIPGAASALPHQDNDDTRLHVVGRGATGESSLGALASGGGPTAWSSFRKEEQAGSPQGAGLQRLEQPRDDATMLQTTGSSSALELSEAEEDVFAETAWVTGADSQSDALDKVGLAREVCTSFARVTRTFQLYDANNNAVREALAALFRQLMGFLDAFESLALHIEPWTMVMDSEVVYSNDDREHSIAYKLYRDGIRGLRLQQGLHWEELAQLLKIMGMRYSGVHVFEDDIATLFWKANFRFVDFVAIEGFGFERHSDSDKRGIELLFERILEEQGGEAWSGALESGRRGQIGSGDRSRGAMLSPAIREENAQGLLRTLKAMPIQFQSLHQRDVRPLLQENSLDRLHEHMGQLFRYIDKIVLDLTAVTGSEGIRHLLREYRNFLMTEGYPEGLVELLQRASRWIQLVDARGRVLAPLAQELLESFNDGELLRRMFTSTKLVDAFGNLPEALYTVLRWDDIDRREILLAILEAETNERVKDAVKKAVVELSGEDIELFRFWLMRASSALAVALIDCLYAVGTREALELIVSQMESTDVEVQEKVVGMAEELFQGPESFSAVRSVLQRLLASDKEDDRMRAYRLIERSGDRRWAGMLRKEIQSKRSRSDRETEELIRLATRLEPQSMMPLLLEWAEPPGMLERTRRKQLRRAAVGALGQAGGAVAEKAIRALMEHSDDVLHESCLSAMREMRRNQGVEPHKLPHRLQRESEERRRELEDADATVMSDNRHDLVADAQDVDLKRLQDMMIKSLQHIDFNTENEFASLVRELGHQFVVSLHMLVKNRNLYDPNNEVFTRPLEEVEEILEKMLQQLVSLTLVGADGQFYINEVRVRTQSENSQQIFAELQQTLARHKLGGITFAFPMTAEEWRLLIDLLAGQGEGEGIHGWRDIREAALAKGLGRKVEIFGQLRTRLMGEDEQSGPRPLSAIFIDGFDAVEEVWYFAVRGQAPNPLPIRRVVNELIDALLENKLRDLAVLALEDPAEPLKTHWLQVTLLSLLVGQELGLSRAQLADLGMAAFFHDIGHAVFVDPEVRRGEGWQSLNHQQAGVALMLKHRGFTEAKVKRTLAIYEHHMNATPFTSQPKPVLYSRIVRIADVYDTLTSAICGGEPLSPTEALEHMASGASKHFDPLIFQALVNRLGRYPTGTIVGLQDGSIAVSLGHNGKSDNFNRPTLVMIRDAEGKPVPQAIQDLSEDEDLHLRVVGIVPKDPALEPKKSVVRRLWPRVANYLEEKARLAGTSY